jgi:uncharacterized protein involved in response to NO
MKKALPIHPLPESPGTPPGPASQPAPWRFNRLFSAPHRLAFAAAALLFALTGAWWAVAMVGHALGVAWPWSLPPAIAHGLLMGLGFMPMFFIGFLFTAGPKWLALPDVEARRVAAPLALQLAGWGVFLVATHAAFTPLAAALGSAALGAATLGWTLAVLRFARLVFASTVNDRVHAGTVLAAGIVGMVALAISASGVAVERYDVVRAATQAALWGFIGVVFVTVSHRMIPFFTAAALPALDAWRPLWLLVVFVAVLGIEAAVAMVEALWWPLPFALRAAQVAVEAPAALLLLVLAVRWGLVQSLKVRLLAMLHVGFVWLGLALALSAISHALLLASGGERSLGLAPLHAYTMGYLGSTLLAMVTRVSAGHSGRPLAADDFVWRLFLGLQGVVVLRVAIGAGAAAGIGEAPLPIALTAIGWALVVVVWARRYIGWYGRPRVDGRRG